MSSSTSGLSEQQSISKTEIRCLPHALLIGGTITLLVVGILATVGVMNGMGSAPASYLSYGAYAGAALFTLAEISFIAVKYCKGSSQSSAPPAAPPLKITTYNRNLTETECSFLITYTENYAAEFFKQLQPNPYQGSFIDSALFTELIISIIKGCDDSQDYTGSLSENPSDHYNTILIPVNNSYSIYVGQPDTERTFYTFTEEQKSTLLNFLVEAFEALPKSTAEPESKKKGASQSINSKCSY